MTLDREFSKAGVQGAEVSALGRGPRGIELERDRMEAELSREREEREGSCLKMQRAAGEGSGRPSLNGEGKDPADSVKNWGGQDGTGSGNKRAFRCRCTGITPQGGDGQ